jgi:hypothetical protein
MVKLHFQEEEEEIDKMQALSFNLQFCYLQTDRYHRVSILKSLQAKQATFLQKKKKGKKGYCQQKRGGEKNNDKRRNTMNIQKKKSKPSFPFTAKLSCKHRFNRSR